MQNPKDYDFFLFIDQYLERSLQPGSLELAQAPSVARALGTAIHEAADSLLEAGRTSSDTHLGSMPFVEGGDDATLLDVFKTRATELLTAVEDGEVDAHQLLIQSLDLTDALLAEARKRHWGPNEFTRLGRLSIRLMQVLKAR